MKKIIVDKKMLEKKLLQVNNKDLIELCIIPSQTDLGILSPAFLHLGVLHRDGTYEDLESIDEISNAGQFKKESA